MSQQDLFDFSSRGKTLSSAASETPATTAFSFLEQTRLSLRLDHLLTLSMAVLVGTALIYASGIERGKRSVWNPPHYAKEAVPLEKTPQVDIKGPEVLAPAGQHTAGIEMLGTSVVSSSSYSKTETRVSMKNTTATPDGSFTIQLATYKAESIAQKKIESLSKQGLEGFLIPSGSYYQVCVNGFSKKVEASQSLTRLKSKGIAPRDAYVRAIPA